MKKMNELSKFIYKFHVNNIYLVSSGTIFKFFLPSDDRNGYALKPLKVLTKPLIISKSVTKLNDNLTI